MLGYHMDRIGDEFVEFMYNLYRTDYDGLMRLKSKKDMRVLIEYILWYDSVRGSVDFYVPIHLHDIHQRITHWVTTDIIAFKNDYDYFTYLDFLKDGLYLFTFRSN